MGKTPAATALLLATALSAGAAAQDARKIVDAASRAMGVEGLSSITYSGIAATGDFGQSRSISFGLASASINDYTRTIDFSGPASYATGRTLPPRPTVARRGEAVPDPPAAPQVLGTFTQSITPASPGWAEQSQIWMTPWGFLRGAVEAGATARNRTIEGVDYKVVTWSPAQKAPSGASYRLVGYINPDNLVDRVETWVEHPVLGDMHVAMLYSDYRVFDGVMVPTRIAERQVGMETFVASIRAADANPANLDVLLAAAPAGPQNRTRPTSDAAAERLADGVYRITGGYVALAVEFKDHVVVLEGGQSEARGLAIIAETKKLFPSKRIRYVVNSHPHFDHAGGLAPFVADGASVITDDVNRYWLEQALGSPRTLVGDTLGKSGKKPKVEGVLDKRVLRDETRTIELHHVQKLAHSDGMLIAYLPKEKILFTADFNAPAPGQPVSPAIATLIEHIDRLKLDFDRHILVHTPNPDRPMTRADLLALAQGAN